MPDGGWLYWFKWNVIWPIFFKNLKYSWTYNQIKDYKRQNIFSHKWTLKPKILSLLPSLNSKRNTDSLPKRSNRSRIRSSTSAKKPRAKIQTARKSSLPKMVITHSWTILFSQAGRSLDHISLFFQTCSKTTSACKRSPYPRRRETTRPLRRKRTRRWSTRGQSSSLSSNLKSFLKPNPSLRGSSEREPPQKRLPKSWNQFWRTPRPERSAKRRPRVLSTRPIISMSSSDATRTWSKWLLALTRSLSLWDHLNS